MSSLHWTEQARQDIDDIYDFIARYDRRPLSAERVVEALVGACSSYADYYAAGSVIGAARPELGEDYRAFTHKRWVVLFRPLDDGIEVMRVLDGSRDYPRLFGE